MAGLAALLESLCLGDGGSLLCALCIWPNALCVVLLYEAYSAGLGCRYLWVFGLDKSVKSLFEEHAGCDLVFLMVIFVYVGYLIHLDGC